MSEQHVENDIEWSRHIANTLILIGLLGTLFGLSFAVAAISRNINAISNFSELQQAVLSGLGFTRTAFFTSLAGITGMVILSTLVMSLSHAYGLLLNDLENFTEDYLARHLFPKDKEERLNAVIEEIHPLISDLGFKMDQMAGFTANIGTHIDHFVEMSLVFKAGTENITNTYDDLRRLFEAIYRNQEKLEVTIGSFKQHASALVQKHENLFNKSTEQLELLEKNLDLSREMLEAQKEYLKTVSGLPEVISEKMTKVVTKHEKSMHPLLESMNGFVARLNKLNTEGTQALGEMIHTFNQNLEYGLSEYKTEMVEHYDKQFQQIGESISQNFVEMSKVVQELNRLVSRIGSLSNRPYNSQIIR
jgi:ABC-type transporter Mla subunit MlaD